MKFDYEYRTSDNVLQRGALVAPTRDAAYATLKERGIRPSRVTESPGLINKLFGKCKRWIAIGILLISCLALWYSLHDARSTEYEARLYEDRAQLYGDPVVIADCESAGWTNVFTSAVDCHLAAYAIPGKSVKAAAPSSLLLATDALSDALTTPVRVSENDLAEIAQMKRMVNGMKREIAEYLAAGGTLKSYFKRLEIRQKAERGIFETTQRQIMRSKDHDLWRQKNAELRAMGLPMVEPPTEE